MTDVTIEALDAAGLVQPYWLVCYYQGSGNAFAFVRFAGSIGAGPLGNEGAILSAIHNHRMMAGTDAGELGDYMLNGMVQWPVEASVDDIDHVIDDAFEQGLPKITLLA